MEGNGALFATNGEEGWKFARAAAFVEGSSVSNSPIVPLDSSVAAAPMEVPEQEPTARPPANELFCVVCLDLPRNIVTGATT